ncbi:Uncharacterised protein [uncultured archaeon]|nr:Uncharacterised protein [uncultured archaeon]
MYPSRFSIARAKALITCSLSTVFGSAKIPDFPPPCGSPAMAFLYVIARASLRISVAVTSGAILTPPIEGPAATLSITTMAFNCIFGSYKKTVFSGPISSTTSKTVSVVSITFPHPLGVIGLYGKLILWCCSQHWRGAEGDAADRPLKIYLCDSRPSLKCFIIPVNDCLDLLYLLDVTFDRSENTQTTTNSLMYTL